MRESSSQTKVENKQDNAHLMIVPMYLFLSHIHGRHIHPLQQIVDLLLLLVSDNQPARWSCEKM